jgi:hypothetical protein
MATVQQAKLRLQLAKFPTATLQLAPLAFLNADAPIPTLLPPLEPAHMAPDPMAMENCIAVLAAKAFVPIATLFKIDPALAADALHPSEVLEATVQPRTIPAAVGVAALTVRLPQVKPLVQAAQAISA